MCNFTVLKVFFYGRYDEAHIAQNDIGNHYSLHHLDIF